MVSAISPFEYVTILVSIILGLGITQILSSFAELVYDYKKVKFFWVHNVWVLLILYIHIQEWFILYELKDYPSWKLSVFLFILLYPIALYVAAKMLFPVIKNSMTVDLKTFFLNNYKPLYLLLFVCIILSIIFNIFLLHINVKEQIYLFGLCIITAFLLLQKSLPIRFHFGFAVLLLLFALASILLESDTWEVK